MKTVKIIKITKRHYKGEVYNFHLESNDPDKDKDDLFWIEQNTGIVSHNCFPKDLNAIIHVMKDLGLDPKVMSAVWEQNKALRKNLDWETISGAVSKK